MKNFLTLLLISISLIGFALMSGCASVFVEPAFTEREYFEDGTPGNLSWAMNSAYNAEYGYKGLCERRSLHAQKLVPDSYVVGMTMKREKAQGVVGKLSHAVLCKNFLCVDSTGVIADRWTTFDVNELDYHAYDIMPLDDYKLSLLQ